MSVQPDLHELVLARLKQGQSGDGQSVPKDIRQAVVDALELETALAALEKVRVDRATSPLEVLDKVGFDIKAVTEAHRGLAEAYKEMLQAERDVRKDKEREAREADKRAASAEAELIKTLVGQMISELKREVQEIREGLGKRAEAQKAEDPLSRALQEVAAQVVKDVMTQRLSSRDPVQEVMQSISIMEMLKEKLGGKDIAVERVAQTADPEVLIGLERVNREFDLKKLELDLQKEQRQLTLQVVEKIAKNLGDIASAAWALINQRISEGGTQGAPQAVAGPSADAQG